MLSILLQTQAAPANLSYLFAALALSWAVFFIYAFWMSKRQGDLRKEIRELHESQEDRET